MKIRIVDTDRTPFWGIPEAEIHLSSEDNAFVDIDYTKLTPYQQQTLWSALRMETIEADDDVEFQTSFRATLKDYLEKRQKAQVAQTKQIFGLDQSPSDTSAVKNVQRAEEIKKLMEGSVAALKKSLPSLSAVDLEMAQKIELFGKNRKTVISFINDLVNKQTKESVKKVESNHAPDQDEFEKRQVFKGQNRKYLPNVGNVRESEKEQIVIKIGED